MTLKQKINNFISTLKTNISNLKTNQTVMVCCLFSVIYLLSGYWKWIEILASLCLLTFMAFTSLQNAFCVFMFSHSFTLSNIGYDSCFMVTFIGFCLVLFVKYYKGVKLGKYQFYKKIAATIGLFLVVGVTLSLFKPMYRGAWLYFAYFALFYLIFAMRQEFNISQGMNFMLGGLVTSAALAFASIILPLFQYEVLPGNRFTAFINNPNYLYMRAMFVLTYYMYRYLNKNISHIKFGIIYLICAILTLASLSKTGMAMLAIFTLFFLVIFLKQDFKKRIKVVGIFALFALVLAAICYKLLIIIWSRFADAFSSNNFLRSLLTGRDLIWSMYLDAIFKNPFTALFGHGLLREQIFIASIFGPTETHNFYIFLLYRFGILGTTLLAYIVYLFIKELGYKKPKLIAWLPMIFFLLESLCDNTFKCYNIAYLLCAIMILFVEQKQAKTSNENIENKQIENKN